MEENTVRPQHRRMVAFSTAKVIMRAAIALNRLQDRDFRDEVLSALEQVKYEAEKMQREAEDAVEFLRRI